MLVYQELYDYMYVHLIYQWGLPKKCNNTWCFVLYNNRFSFFKSERLHKNYNVYYKEMHYNMLCNLL